MGVIALIFCLLQLVVAIPFLAKIEAFNPLNDTLEHFYPYVSTFIESFNVSSNVSQDIMEEVRKYIWYSILGEAMASIVYFVLALIMVLGIRWDMRFLMIPHLIVHILYIILCIFIGLAVTAIFFFGQNTEKEGTTSAIAVLVLEFCFVYFWVVVQKAYIELGHQDYMYSSEPIEFTYNSGQPHNLSYGGDDKGLDPIYQMEKMDSFIYNLSN